MEGTIIAWTDSTFNPAMGCTKVSAGCTNCYAEVLTRDRMGLSLWGPNGRRQRTSASNWKKPQQWNRAALAAGESSRVFCASLCDVFEEHRDIDALRPDLWNLIRECTALDWQLLTKRPERIAECLPKDWGNGWPHVWLGTTIEDERVAARADYLRAIPAAVRFISYEPAIGPLAHALDLKGLHWVIYGGESGPKRRLEDKQWARDMRDACHAAGVAFFHKQSAGIRTEMGIELDGKIVREWPQPRRKLNALVA